MLLNELAQTLIPLDMTQTAEYSSLLPSAAELGIPHGDGGPYCSGETVLRGARFHFLEWGDPSLPAVVLLHGGNQSCHSWDLVSVHLAGRFHVLAPDQRGHGDSEWSRDGDYSLEARSADALALIEDQLTTPPIVIGHSMGGMVTMRMALDRPDLVRAVVLVDVGPELGSAGVQAVRDFVVRNVEFDDLDEFLDRVAAYDPYRPREHIHRTVKYNMLQRVDGKYVSKVDHRRVPPGPLTAISLEDTTALHAPVLVVRGADSDVLEPEAAARFVATLPHGQLVTVPGVGHNVHGGNTLGFLEVVDPWLAELA